MSNLLADARSNLESHDISLRVGRVSKVVGLLIEAEGTRARVGELCSIENDTGEEILAEVVGFHEGKLLLMPYRSMSGVHAGSHVRPSGHPLRLKLGKALIGRVLDGLGRPMDNLEDPVLRHSRDIRSRAPKPLERAPIHKSFQTGIKSIDGMLTCGEGQRMGIFAGSGVGKSVLLGMLARNAEADVVVLALIGERGREVREFIEESLGPEGLARSVVVAVTSDATALERVKGAETAMAIAEYFRDQGNKVLVMMDSVTRYAMALREIGLATGEPTASKGYTPSVFAALPKLLERAGINEKGSITGLFTVLVEGDDLNEPISGAVRAILDGHVVLSRRLASLGQFPAVDLLNSVSRLFPKVSTQEQVESARRLIESMAIYRENEDLIQIGAYQPGSSEEIDRAIELRPRWIEFLRQDITERCEMNDTLNALKELVSS